MGQDKKVAKWFFFYVATHDKLSKNFRFFAFSITFMLPLAHTGITGKDLICFIYFNNNLLQSHPHFLNVIDVIFSFS